MPLDSPDLILQEVSRIVHVIIPRHAKWLLHLVVAYVLSCISKGWIIMHESALGSVEWHLQFPAYVNKCKPDFTISPLPWEPIQAPAALSPEPPEQLLGA